MSLISPFIALWLPTVLSAVAVFVLSSIMHMVIPKWHQGDYPTLPNEDGVLDALRPFAIPPGEYMAPRPKNSGDWKSPEFQEKQKRGPVFMINVFPTGDMSMLRPLGLWFVYVLIIAALAGHIAYGALHEMPDEHMIFHTVALTSFLGYAGALWQGTVWYRRSWVTSLKSTIDGAVYALATGWIFCYFWPK